MTGTVRFDDPSSARRTMALGTLLLALVAGCGEGHPDRVAVSGQVLIDGQPLKYGQILFVPKGGRPSRAELDENGRFELSSFDPKDGAALGTHEIAVFANEQLNQSDTRWHAPKKYANQATSGLKREITGPVKDLVIELSWDGGKPFTEVSKASEELSKSGKSVPKQASE